MLGILQGLGLFVALPVLVGFMVVGSSVLWARFKRGVKPFTDLVCSTDTDCPQGYVCENGVCVPVRH